jgi:hypothetical protein
MSHLPLPYAAAGYTWGGLRHQYVTPTFPI